MTATTPQRLETLAGRLIEDGWQLVGPVQVACGADVDGGWNVVYAATLSGPASPRGSGAADPNIASPERMIAVTRDDLETLIHRLSILHSVWDDPAERDLELIRLSTFAGGAAVADEIAGPAGRPYRAAPKPDPDILDQDPMLDDTARESIWDRR